VEEVEKPKEEKEDDIMDEFDDMVSICDLTVW